MMNVSDGELKSIEMQHREVMEELERRREERAEHEKTLALIDTVYTQYADIENKDAFIELCRVNGAYTESEVSAIYKKLPRSARKGLLAKFFA